MKIPIIGDIVGAVKDLVSEVVVDKDKKNELNVRLQELADKADDRLHQQLMGQIDVNKVEAAHPSIFVAGWRPAVGWISAVGLGWQFVLSPFAETVARWSGWTGTMPVVDTESLMMLVLGMLGIGAQRSFEKFKGVDTTKVVRNK
jgi:uncharacterized membrane protein (DUF106 family)